MSRHSAPDFSYPRYTKLWLILCAIANFLFGISFLYTHAFIIPFLAYALINLYSFLLLLKGNRQGFYTLCSAFAIFAGYTLFLHKPVIFRAVCIVNLAAVFITWICISSFWQEKKAEE